MKFPKPEGAAASQSLTLSDGRILEFFDNGVDSDQALLFHHGTPGAGDIWQSSFDKAAEQGVRAIAYSKPGYSGSDQSDAANVAEVGSDIRELIERLNLSSFVSVAWSGGGPYALHSTFAEQCKGADLIAGVAPYFEMGPEFLVGQPETETIEQLNALALSRENSLEYAIKDMEHIQDEWNVSTWTTGAQARPRFEEFKADYEKFIAYTIPALLNCVIPDVKGYADDTFRILKDWGFAVREVSKPVSIWNGMLDLPVPPGHAKWQHSQISGSDLHLLDGQTHLSIMVEHADEILASAIAKLNA